jgi:hypothetical protein
MDNQVYLPVVVIVLGLFVLGFWWISRGGMRMQAEQKARLARSQPAKARVLQVGKSVNQENQNIVVVKLRLEVTPTDAAAYPVTTVWEVQPGALGQIQQDRWIDVKVDADDAQMIYPNVDWAEFSDLYWQIWVKDKQHK